MLSLAIGREGQNARLAAKLTGWRIDIRSDQVPAADAPPRAAGRRAAEPPRPAVVEAAAEARDAAEAAGR